MPVSRTRKPSKKKNSLAPSSKEARQKIRRWSFVVEVTRGDTVKTFQPPALTIGNMTSARAAADTILNDIASLDQFKDCKVVVNPKAEETVSLTILNQINGLNEQSRLLTFALKRAVTDVVKQDTRLPVPPDRGRGCSSGRVRSPCDRAPRQVRDGGTASHAPATDDRRWH